jgi:predicted O-methyltransferase YrrM
MKNYKDIAGWFHDTSAEKLTELIETHNIKSVIEIGSFVGKSTVFFAQNANIERVLCVDPFIMWEEGKQNGDAQAFGEDFYEEFLKNIQEAEVTEKISVLRMSSKEAFNKDVDTDSLAYADLIYIDGAHDYVSIFNDIVMWRMRAVSVICGDDYDEHWLDVKKAVDEIFGDRVKVAGNLWYVETI